MALGLLSRRESRKDLWLRLITLLLLYFMLLYSLLFAARWWFPEDVSLRQDQTFSLFWHFCSPVHIYSLPLIMLHMQCRSLLASTLDEYSVLLCPPFPPFFFFPVDATRWWILGARCHRRRILLHGDRRRLGVVRRSQAGGLVSSIIVAFVLAFLRHPCLTYVFTHILLLPLTLVFEPSRPLACNMKLVLF